MYIAPYRTYYGWGIAEPLVCKNHRKQTGGKFPWNVILQNRKKQWTNHRFM